MGVRLVMSKCADRLIHKIYEVEIISLCLDRFTFHINQILLKTILSFLGICIFLASPLYAQQRVWIAKENAPSHLIPDFCSKWLDQCSYTLTTEQFSMLKSEVAPVLSFEPAQFKIDNYDLGFALEQLQAEKLIAKGLTGKGVKIGIIDGGFLAADKSPALQHFFQDSLVAQYRDFITPDMEPYSGSAALDDVHGTEVWQLIGGINHENQIQFGLATGATYYLARTDHGAFEKRIEEDKLIEALEWMHDEGVKLVNISLGYAKDYTNPRENYNPEEMDGKTSAIARAVDSAFFSKKMLVIVAAGNEAMDPRWRVLSTPGDAKGALTVGASKLSIWERMDYSSVGTPGLSFVKPNISCFAGDGTSFATPVITGLAALLMEQFPDLSASDLKNLIERSGHYFPFPNDHVGFGVPISDRFFLEDKDDQKSVITIKAVNSRVKLRETYQKPYVTVLHKSNGFHVEKYEVIRPKHEWIKVKKHKYCTQTSVMIDNRVWEIFWE